MAKFSSISYETYLSYVSPILRADLFAIYYVIILEHCPYVQLKKKEGKEK